MAANEQSGVPTLGAETVFVDLADGRRIHMGKSVRDRVGWASAASPVPIIIQTLPAGRALLRPAEQVEAWVDRLVAQEGEQIRADLALVLFATTVQTNGNVFLPTPVVKALSEPEKTLMELVVRSGPDVIELMNRSAYEAAQARVQDWLANLPTTP